jgi:hypothetical protein
MRLGAAPKPAKPPPMVKTEIPLDAISTHTLRLLKTDLAYASREAIRKRRKVGAQALLQTLNAIDQHLAGRTRSSPHVE